MSATGGLVCSGCATPHGLDERFCRRCGMPLVFEGAPEGEDEDTVSRSHDRARKVKKQYLDGDLVRVAGARNQAEAEMIQGILLEEGVPSMLRRTRGFDVPDMLAAGPRDVVVPEGGLAVARETLLQADLLGPAPDGAGVDGPGRIALILLGLLLVVALVAFVGTTLLD